MNYEERIRFGNYLRSLRSAKGLTQRAAAAQADISCPYLTQLEKGQRNPPSREILERLAKLYKVNEEKMLEEAGYREKKGLNSISEERIEWAFRAVQQDPNWTYGTRAREEEFSIESKAFIVEVYQQATGRYLLTATEQEGRKALLPEVK